MVEKFLYSLTLPCSLPTKCFTKLYCVIYNGHVTGCKKFAMSWLPAKTLNISNRQTCPYCVPLSQVKSNVKYCSCKLWLSNQIIEQILNLWCLLMIYLYAWGMSSITVFRELSHEKKAKTFIFIVCLHAGYCWTIYCLKYIGTWDFCTSSITVFWELSHEQKANNFIFIVCLYAGYCWTNYNLKLIGTWDFCNLVRNNKNLHLL